MTIELAALSIFALVCMLILMRRPTKVESFCKSKNAGIDACVQSAVDYLNEHGYKTVASCCGHGHQPTRISLGDMEILFLSYEQAQQVCEVLTDINGEQP